MIVDFILNGKNVSVDVEADEVLVDTLREKLMLTGTKKGCGTGDCGSGTHGSASCKMKNSITLCYET